MICTITECGESHEAIAYALPGGHELIVSPCPHIPAGHIGVTNRGGTDLSLIKGHPLSLVLAEEEGIASDPHLYRCESCGAEAEVRSNRARVACIVCDEQAILDGYGAWSMVMVNAFWKMQISTLTCHRIGEVNSTLGQYVESERDAQRKAEAINRGLIRTHGDGSEVEEMIVQEIHDLGELQHKEPEIDWKHEYETDMAVAQRTGLFYEQDRPAPQSPEAYEAGVKKVLALDEAMGKDEGVAKFEAPLPGESDDKPVTIYRDGQAVKSVR